MRLSYKLNRANMLLLGRLNLGNEDVGFETYQYLEGYFVDSVDERVAVFTDWLQQLGLPSSFLDFGAVEEVHHTFLDNMNIISYRDGHQGFLNSPLISPLIYGQLPYTLLSPEWDSLFLDLAVKIAHDHMEVNPDIVWGIQDFFPGDALSNGKMNLFLESSGECKSERSRVNFMYEAYELPAHFAAGREPYSYGKVWTTLNGWL